MGFFDSIISGVSSAVSKANLTALTEVYKKLLRLPEDRLESFICNQERNKK